MSSFAIINIAAPPSTPSESRGYLKRLQSRAAALVGRLWSGDSRSTDRLLDALPSKSLSNSTDCIYDTYLKVAPRAIRDPISKAYIRATFGYRFKNLDLLEEAFDASSFYPDHPDMNKNMALVGDKIIDLILLNDWDRTGQTKTKGGASDILSTVASNANMTQIARRIGLGKHLVLHLSQRRQGPSPYMLATALEAVFGAIYKDYGGKLDVVKAAMNKIGLTVASKDEAKANVEKAKEVKADEEKPTEEKVV